MFKYSPILAALLVAAPAVAADVAFIEETGQSGVSHAYTGGFQHFVGGGVAAFDCDQNAIPDLYLAGGEDLAALYRNVSQPGAALRFVAADNPATALTGVTGAYPLDVDGDEILDLFVMRTGENALLRGIGDCSFERANELWGFDGGTSWTTAFAANWFDETAFPTLAVGNYTQPDHDGGTFGVCQPNQVIRPNGDAFRQPAALDPSYCALSMLFTSWRGSGAPDLRISNDREYYPAGGTEQLIRIGEHGIAPYAATDGWQTLRIWGMAIATHDVTGDGLPDYYLTSMADNKLRAISHDTGDLTPSFADNAFAFGVTAHRPSVGDQSKPSTSWHAEFADVDNDGDADLFVAKGNVEAMAEFAMEDPNALLIRDGDTFVDRATAVGVASPHRGRGAAMVDLNADGALDLVVVNRKAPAQIWRNTADLGNWLQFALRQDNANAHGAGAWIEVTTAAGTTRRQLTIGGGHAGGQFGWLHFGLGQSDTADVAITWPDGGTSTWQIQANRHVLLRRGQDQPIEVEPGVI